MTKRWRSGLSVASANDALTRRTFLRAAGLSTGLVALIPGVRTLVSKRVALGRRMPTRLLYRLSSRNEADPCRACKNHDAHRYYRTILAADTNRAHKRCGCQVLTQRVPVPTYERYFAPQHRNVFDDRWGKKKGKGR